jgi:hypothetical protein
VKGWKWLQVQVMKAASWKAHLTETNFASSVRVDALVLSLIGLKMVA